MTDQGLGRIESYGLGRNVSTKDFRDYPLGAYIRGVSEITEKMWPFTVDALNQLETVHCGGFTMAHYGICHQMPSMYTNGDGHNFYEQCNITDGTPGLQNGTSCRTMAVTGKRLGMWKTYAFATTMEEIDYWLLNEGSLMVGTEWTEGMFFPDANNIIHPTGAVAGGHAWLLNGKIPGFKHGITSWGPDFGINGGFWISDADFESLFHQQGEAIAAVEVAKVDPSVVQSGCRNTPIGKALQRIWG